MTQILRSTIIYNWTKWKVYEQLPRNRGAGLPHNNKIDNIWKNKNEAIVLIMAKK